MAGKFVCVQAGRTVCTLKNYPPFIEIYIPHKEEMASPIFERLTDDDVLRGDLVARVRLRSLVGGSTSLLKGLFQKRCKIYSSSEIEVRFYSQLLFDIMKEFISL